MDEAQVGVTSISLEHLAIGVNHSAGLVLAAGSLATDGLEFNLTATAETAAMDVDLRIPLERGWISWYVVPRLALSGEMVVAGERWSLETASAYHDHNWGRWNWGSDFGWEWGAFLAPRNGPTVVLTRLTDRAHRPNENARLDVRLAGRSHTFAGSTLSVDLLGDLNVRLRRLPGVLAALHGDRERPRLPERVHIRAGDDAEGVDLEFVADGAAQLIAADPVTRGYGFIHEISGRFTCTGEIEGSTFSAQGLGIFEYVD
jgi:hypothetical protein